MYKEIDTIPAWSLGKVHTHRYRSAGREGFVEEAGFKCRYCQAHVHNLLVFAGVHNRNHCPYCLWSRHVDLIRIGDRMSACKAIMQPIGLTVKQSRNKYGVEKYGELMLIHCCNECGKLSINRIAADDHVESLMEIFHASLGLDPSRKHQLEVNGIRLLQEKDMKLVITQLQGNRQN